MLGPGPPAAKALSGNGQTRGQPLTKRHLVLLCYGTKSIANLVAPPFSQLPPEGYETYASIRKAAHTVQWDELLSSGTLICGNPASCIRQIEDLQTKYGFTQILCWTRLSGLENRKVPRSMELMQRHVIPHFKRQAHGGGTGRAGLRS
jgi:alkanesulfonate monooxygenase SsuD/methylene tetrahydromethanopterin reductase-like flavin-dependent oxidoreductase (luciferase family)